CSPGSFAASPRSASCTPCPAGSACPSAGTVSPTPCPNGTTSKRGGRFCVAGAVVCADVQFGGICETFAVSRNSLVGSRVGNDTASSIDVPSGVVASLFSDANYEGTCETFGRSNPDLRDSAIGNDTASSIRIGAECPGLAGGVACQNCPRTWGKLPGL